MSIAGTYTFNVNVNTLIKRTLQKLTVIAPGQDPAPEDYELALEELNMMILAWEADGLHLWTEEESTLFLEIGKKSYILGGSSSDRLSSSIVKTELAADYTTSTTALTVDTTVGMTVGDSIGVELDNNTIHWTTIATIPTSTTLTLTLGITSAASTDNNVYTYTTLTPSIININQVVLRKDSEFDLELKPLSRNEYKGIPNKSTQSTPYQYYVDKRRDNLVLYVYGTSSNVSDRIVIQHKRAFSDMVSSTDLFDFPRQWLEPLMYNLAVRLASTFEKDEKITNGVIATIATQSLKKLKGWDKEDVSIFIGTTNGK